MADLEDSVLKKYYNKLKDTNTAAKRNKNTLQTAAKMINFFI